MKVAILVLTRTKVTDEQYATIKDCIPERINSFIDAIIGRKVEENDLYFINTGHKWSEMNEVIDRINGNGEYGGFVVWLTPGVLKTKLFITGFSTVLKRLNLPNAFQLQYVNNQISSLENSQIELYSIGVIRPTPKINF